MCLTIVSLAHTALEILILYKKMHITGLCVCVCASVHVVCVCVGKWLDPIMGKMV